MIDRGELYPEDSATVITRNGEFPVTVEAIEGYQLSELPKALPGQQVGLRLRGTMKSHEVTTGDKMHGKPPS
jgi:hypothetical protein